MPIQGNQMNVAGELTGDNRMPADRAELMERIRQLRDTKPEQPRPVGPTDRQREQTRLEMEAGAKRSAFFAEQAKNREQPPPDPNAPRIEPVFVDGNYQYEPGKSAGKQ